MRLLNVQRLGVGWVRCALGIRHCIEGHGPGGVGCGSVERLARCADKCPECGHRLLAFFNDEGAFVGRGNQFPEDVGGHKVRPRWRCAIVFAAGIRFRVVELVHLVFIGCAKHAGVGCVAVAVGGVLGKHPRIDHVGQRDLDRNIDQCLFARLLD